MATIAGWAVLVLALAWAGVFQRFAGLEVPPIIFLSIALPVGLAFVSRPLRDTLGAISLRTLTAVHLLRYVGAAGIFYLGRTAQMPPLLVSLAGWGDVIAASVALLVLVAPFARWRFVLAHAVSLADFTTSLVAGLLLTLAEDPEMAKMTRVPGAFILFFVIGFYSTNSIVALRRLLRREPA